MNFRAMRGAIFGMDARIALIVFAMLSTLTGFVLYQRAEEVQDVRLYGNIQEIERGLKMLQRDMGGIYPAHVSTDGINSACDEQMSMLYTTTSVVATFQKRWNGPYINRDSIDDTFKALNIQYCLYNFTTNLNEACTATGPCYMWLNISTLPNTAFEYLNRIVDEDNGAFAELDPDINGRVQRNGAAPTYNVWYRTEVNR